MAWLTPRTWIPGELVTDAIMNLHVRDQLAAIASALNDQWIPASDCDLPLTAPCGPREIFHSGTTGTYSEQVGYPFDQTLEENILTPLLILPKRWNKLTVTFSVYWTAKAGAGDAYWGMLCKAHSNADTLNSSFGTSTTSLDTLIAAYATHISPQTAPFQIEGTISPSDLIRCVVRRSAAAAPDTLTADAYFLGLLIRWTQDTVTDA